MIYGRSKQPVKVLRLASAADFREIEGVKPQPEDYQAMANQNYLVIDDSGTLRIYRKHWLKADGGEDEIEGVVVKITPPPPTPVILVPLDRFLEGSDIET